MYLALQSQHKVVGHGKSQPTYLKWLANGFFTQQQIHELVNTLSTQFCRKKVADHYK